MAKKNAPSPLLKRQHWLLQGQVQGVGFRPFVLRLACQTGVTGFVRNESSAVVIEAQGHPSEVDSFARGLFSSGPGLSRIDHSILSDMPVFSGENEFVIAVSAGDTAERPTVTPDLATCGACLEEIRERSEPRFGYALTNCTQCGPRYSIILDTPYDRERTTMRRFAVCEKCHQQYLSPADRRFHAQPIACPKCGPAVELLLPRKGLPAPGPSPSFGAASTSPWRSLQASPLREAAKLLLAGKIVAIKGIGGYHLAVRADDEAAVGELCRRKHRDAKPFALMVAGMTAARRLVRLSIKAEAALTSPASPIVLAPHVAGTRVAAGVAPQAHRLGVMLPYTPMQHLLFDAMRRLAGEVPPLVMTSANISDEPLIKDDAEAERLLPDLCDAILRHGREVERSVDDSVLLDMGEEEPLLPVRRSRGYVPRPVRMSLARGPGLCLGGELKNTVALAREEEVILSQHLGDLKHPLALSNFRRTIADFTKLFKTKPRWIAHDLHPSYLSSEYARQLAQQYDVPTIAVQHHHAHAAAALAEHNFVGEALAIVCDGAGYGSDGTIWGGELLRVNTEMGTFERLASLPPFALPGGDAAAKETRRAAAGLLQLLPDDDVKARTMARLYPDDAERQQLEQVVAARVNCPATSAAGRWFDAVAAILGAATHNRYEGEAPMRLEAMANEAMAQRAEPPTLRHLAVNDQPSLVNEIAREALGLHSSSIDGARRLSLKFHIGFAAAWANTAIRIAREIGLKTVALSGGCFCNELLTRSVNSALTEHGLRVLRHEVVPPNDGGIALGQAAVASVLAQQKGWL